MSNFRNDLEDLINRHSQEDGCNTPNYILADFLCNCLLAFDTAVNHRERWYGRDGGRRSPVQPTDLNTLAPEAEAAPPIDLDSVLDQNFTAGLDPVEYLRQFHGGVLHRARSGGQGEEGKMSDNCAVDDCQKRLLEYEIERLRAALRSIAELKPEDMPHGDTHLAEVIARAALEAAARVRE